MLELRAVRGSKLWGGQLRLVGKLRLLSYVKGINRKHLVNSLLIASISSNGLFVVWVSYLAIVRNLPQSSYAFLKPSTLLSRNQFLL